MTIKKKKAKWMKDNRHDIDIYLGTGFGELFFLPTEDYQFEALEDYFSNYLHDIKIEDDFNPIRPFLEQYVVPRYKRRLKSRSWSTRMNTLYFIHVFRIEDMQDVLIQHLSSPRCSPEESYEIYQILAVFKYEGLIDLLKKDSMELPSFLISELLSILLNMENVDRYIESFSEFPMAWQYVMLDVIRDKNLRSEKVHALLEQLLDVNERELRVRALKTISSLGYITSIGLVFTYMDDMIVNGRWDQAQNAGEKMMLTRLMGSIRNERFIPVLTELISDKTYSIRAEAAKSIRQYRDGKEILLSIASTHPDAYARSISKEWIERNPDYE